MKGRKIRRIPSPGVTVSNFTHNGHIIRYYGDLFIKIAYSIEGSTWIEPGCIVLSPRDNSFDSSPISPMGAIITSKGIMLVYESREEISDGVLLSIGMALFDEKEPARVLWRTPSALYQYACKGEGKPGQGVALARGTKLYLSWPLLGNKMLKVTIPRPAFEKREIPEGERLEVVRYHGNPIISPRADIAWEKDFTFNPAAVCIDGTTHFLYRAVGSGGISMFGYARSEDGAIIDERPKKPAYIPRERFEGVRGNKPKNYRGLFASGWSWGGCEDPKLTYIEEDEKVYLTYVVHDGTWPQRTAISSINVVDFIRRKWDWSWPQLMSPPGSIDSKSACILPEKVNGKYVIFHRVWPDIVIDYVDDLDFSSDKKWIDSTPAIPLYKQDGRFVIISGDWPNFSSEVSEFYDDHTLQRSEKWNKLKEGKHRISARLDAWDSHKISMGSAPIKTKYGWLAVYSAVDINDMSKYKIGAMLLDIGDTVTVIARSNHPVLEPEEWYENDGKPGVAYPGPIIVRDGTLYIYYGGGDKVVCLATTDLDDFVEKLIRHKDIKLTPRVVKHAIKRR